MFSFDGHMTNFEAPEYNGRNQHCSSNSRHFSVSNLLKLGSKRRLSDIDSNEGSYKKLNYLHPRIMFNYPKVRRDETIVDNFFNVQVPDPYRALEDPDSPETKKFVEDQNSISVPYLDGCPYKEAIKKRILELWDYPRVTTPYLRGGKYFRMRNSGLENQDILYISKDLQSDGEVFIDPNKMSLDGTVSLSDYAISEDNQLCAYIINSKGSDWAEIKLRSVLTKEDFPDHLLKVKFSGVSWTHDNAGFFYGAYLDQQGKADGSEVSQMSQMRVYYHKLGTKQTDDVLVYDYDHPEYTVSGNVSYCGKYFLSYVWKGTKDNLVFFGELPEKISGRIEVRPLVKDFQATFSYVTNNGTDFYFETDKGAPNNHIVCIDVTNPDEENWKVIVPEEPNQVLSWCLPFHGDKLIICWMKDVKHHLQLHDLRTGAKIDNIPVGLGTISSGSCRRDDKDFFYSFTSAITPKKYFKVTLEDEKIVNELIHETKINNETFEEELETQQVFYKSKDGTNIPMFLVHRKNLVLDGKNPCLLYGYGGFGHSLMPTFSLSRIIFAKNFKGIAAIANIRGGGEYGFKWHSAAMLEKKQTCFDDFQHAAHFLIGCGYTNPGKLVIEGGSNGGLLVGACINQTPELFGAAIAHVGVMDMLRFHKFTIGHAWKSEYGDPEDEKIFPHLLKYSPLHNIMVPKNGQYPATLLITADHDDRVVPLHSLKYIAELQYQMGSHKAQKNPLLIRVETNAGHGAGKPTNKAIDELTEIFCFISNALDIPFFE